MTSSTFCGLSSNMRRSRDMTYPLDTYQMIRNFCAARSDMVDDFPLWLRQHIKERALGTTDKELNSFHIMLQEGATKAVVLDYSRTSLQTRYARLVNKGIIIQECLDEQKL